MVYVAVQALPTEIESRGNTGIAESGVLSPDWTPYEAAGTEKLPGKAGDCDSHQPSHWLLAWAPPMACPRL